MTLIIPSGSYVFNSAPNPIPGGLRIVGAGKNATAMIKNFSGGILFKLNGKQGYNTGTIIERMAILAQGGTNIGGNNSPGYAVYLTGDSTHMPDETIIRELYVTSDDGSQWYACLYCDGINRTSPQGVRDVTVADCEFFNASGSTVWLRNVVGFSMRNGGVFQGAGTLSGTGIWITGGGTSNTNSNDLSFIGVNNNGVLNITDSTIGRFTGILGSLATDASSHWMIEAICGGSVSDNLVNSVVQLT